jgi:hypothetical protein
MAHWAEVDENNIVLRVVVTDNNDPAGDEGYQWLIDNLGGKWIQTSYNKNFRKNFAGVGGIYDEELDVFLPYKEFDSWILNREILKWEPPVSYPMDGNFYAWDEETKSWKQIPDPREI